MGYPVNSRYLTYKKAPSVNSIHMMDITNPQIKTDAHMLVSNKNTNPITIATIQDMQSNHLVFFRSFVI